MWPAAFVALFTTGPFGVVLFVAALITQGIKVAKVDAEYAKHGKTPPSHALISKWLDSRAAKGAKPEKPAKYGMWRYAWQRWQAMWEDLAERHRDVREQHRTAVAAAKARGEVPPPRPTLKETLTGWKWHLDQLVPPTLAAQASVNGKPGPQSAVPQPGAATDTSGRGAPKPSPRPRASITPTTGPARPEPEPEPEPLRHFLGEDYRNALIGSGRHGGVLEQPTEQPPRRTDIRPTNPQGDTMAQPVQQSGEVTGTRSAAYYAQEVAKAHAQHAANEGYLGSLARMDVGDGDIGLVRAAMQKSMEAGEAWKAAGDSIEKNNAGVREQYSLAPDAANKTANINE